jgi:four helix bundle protein
MHAIHSYRDLVVWQKSMDLVEHVYRASQTFPAAERFGLTAQLRRAAISIPANIAEGHGRTTRGEYANQLSVARGSLKEVETLCDIARRLGLIAQEVSETLFSLCDEISKMLTALKRALAR